MTFHVKLKSPKCLKLIRKMNLNNLVVAHLNFNSVRNKFEALIQNVSGGVELLMISKTKLDESFPKNHFLIKGFSDPFCAHIN